MRWEGLGGGWRFHGEVGLLWIAEEAREATERTGTLVSVHLVFAVVFCWLAFGI